MSELAERLKITRSRLTHAVTRLQQAGYLGRCDDPANRRNQLAVCHRFLRGTSLSSPRTIARRFSRDAGRANTSSTDAHSAYNSPSRAVSGGGISPT
jgi:DNA-binding IclR family transcriptional regulator